MSSQSKSLRNDPLWQAASPVRHERVHVRGKFLFRGHEKLYVRGVTYGTFRPDPDGDEYPPREVLERDFQEMAAQGINSVRTYTAPPRWVLDAAHRFGLFVMVGLAAERYVGFLTDSKGAPDIQAEIKEMVRACAGHPALLCYVLGNEIPASSVRWLGNRRVEQYLKDLYSVVKAEDPNGLVTYANYPSTEYLNLPFLDLLCFNVYLESTATLTAYLARLQNVAGDRPLLMSEVGLDSIRNGEERQAQFFQEQIATSFAAGCAGIFIYAWTDDWFRGGEQVYDWAFGVTRLDRTPKPALAALSEAFRQVPFPAGVAWPLISVVICTYNGSRTIRDALEGVLRLDYPNFEVIVIDDGSTDTTAAIIQRYPVQLIQTANGGLSRARNVGLHAAQGEIIAYLDDDAYPDPQWLQYLAASYQQSSYVGIGGPNLAPPGDGPIAECVAHAPGGPMHVLVSDTEAEHIPGCNSSFRREALLAIGGFDPKFRIAGDDVDLCWRLQAAGGAIGYSPAALVWHHRRNSVRAYWRQQLNYGRAEALLERKWPAKYNPAGHVNWAGRIYGHGWAQLLGGAGRIYHGVWGSAPFQSLYQPAGSLLRSLPLMPEWYLLLVGLLGLGVLGLTWNPLFGLLLLFAIGTSISLWQAGWSAAQMRPPYSGRSLWKQLVFWAVTTILCLLQPLARLLGRIDYGLGFWRRKAHWQFGVLRTEQFSDWTPQWRDPLDRIRTIEARIVEKIPFVQSGGPYDRWDLEVKGGLFGAVRFLMAVEEQGGGCQVVRYRVWPLFSSLGIILLVVLLSLAAAALWGHAYLATGLLGAGAELLALELWGEATWAMNTTKIALAEGSR